MLHHPIGRFEWRQVILNLAGNSFHLIAVSVQNGDRAFVFLLSILLAFYSVPTLERNQPW